MAEGLLEQYEKVKQQAEEIEQLKLADTKHDNLLQQEVLPRLKEVEILQESFKKVQEDFTKEITSIRHAQSSLELTVMKDGQATRDLLGRFVDHYFGTDDKKLVMNEKFTLKRLSATEKVVLGFFAILGGSGGVLAGVAGIIQLMK